MVLLSVGRSEAPLLVVHLSHFRSARLDGTMRETAKSFSFGDFAGALAAIETPRYLNYYYP